MALIFTSTKIHPTLFFITTIMFVFCELVSEKRIFRFCEMVKYRDLTFTFQAVTLTSCNQTLSACASLCIGLAECSWFTYNVQLMKCLILTIPTFQNIGTGTIELGRRHYAFTTGKSYSLLNNKYNIF